MSGNLSAKSKKTQWLLIILLTLLCASIAITIWALFFKEKKVLTPDYAPQEIEQNAESTNTQGEKLEQSEGGGAVSLNYSKKVSINLSNKEAYLLFGNPYKSNQDMVIQIVVKDDIIVQSGLLKPGNLVKKLNLIEGKEKQLSSGGYEGKLVILYYHPDTGEKVIVNTEIPVDITVTN